MPTAESDCTEAVVAYVRDLATRLAPSDVSGFEDEEWRRDNDGFIRRARVLRPFLGFAFRRDRATSEAYARAAQAVRDDSDFGPVVGGMVGDQSSMTRFDEDTVINHAAATLVDEEGRLPLDEDRTREAVAELREYVRASSRPSTVVIPLPGLKSFEFPVVIEPGIEIDVLRDDEINACASCGVLGPTFPGMMGGGGLIRPEDGVGVRIAMHSPARLTPPGTEPEDMSKVIEAELQIPHRFGDRSYWRWAELIEDVLVVLRLASPEPIRTGGAVIMRNSHMGRGYSWSTRASGTFIGTNYFIDEPTRDSIVSLWRTAKSSQGQRLPQICLRRFNAAMDRTSSDDVVIDHLIAAEAGPRPVWVA